MLPLLRSACPTLLSYCGDEEMMMMMMMVMVVVMMVMVVVVMVVVLVVMVIMRKMGLTIPKQSLLVFVRES